MQTATKEFSGDHLAIQMGLRLQEERVRLGLTQTALAQAIGISRTSATLYEAGKHVPRADVLIKLDSLGADVLFLITGRRTAEATVDEVSLAFALEEAMRQNGRTAPVGGMLGLLRSAWPIYLALQRYRSSKAHVGS